MELKSVGRRELLKGNFLLLLLSQFLFVMSRHLLVPMLPNYLGSIGALQIEIGFLIGLVALVAVFSRIPVGRFIDSHGVRWMLYTGITLQSISPFLYPLCTDTTQFLLIKIIQRIGFAAFSVTVNTMVVGLSPRGRLGEVLGLFSLSFLVAQAVGPSVSGLLLSGLGFDITFYASGMVSLLSAFIALRITIKPRTRQAKTEGSFMDVIRNRNLATGSLGRFIVMMPHGVVQAFFPLYAASLGVSPAGIGLYFTVFAISTGIVRPFIGALSDRVGRTVVIVPFALLAALGIGFFVVASDLPGFLVAGAMLGVGMGSANSVVYALFMDTMKPSLRGQAVAVSGTAMDMGISTGSMGMGPIAMFGRYPAAFLSTGVVIVGGTLAFIGIRAVWKKEEKIYT